MPVSPRFAAVDMRVTSSRLILPAVHIKLSPNRCLRSIGRPLLGDRRCNSAVG
jgi:hypothetical protein